MVKVHFCTPSTQSPLEMLHMMEISSITSQSQSQVVLCRVLQSYM